MTKRLCLGVALAILSAVSLRADEFDEAAEELESEARAELDHPSWKKRFEQARRLATDQVRPDWSYESSGAYNEWARQCRAQAKGAVLKLLPEAKDDERREALTELVGLSDGDERDGYCRELLDDPKVHKNQKDRLRALILDNLAFGGGCWSWLYDARHVSFREADWIRRRTEDFFRFAQADIEAHPNDRARVAKRSRQLADAYAALGDYAAAEPWFRRADELGSNAGTLFGLAECRFAAGDTNAAIATLEVQQRKFGGEFRRGAVSYNTSVLGGYALRFLKGTTLSGLGLPLGSLCKAFPTPKKADYSETFVPAAALKVIPQGLAADDARLRFFAKKMTARGFRLADDAPYTVSVELRADAPVDRPEGYALTVSASGATIAARDRQGVLWGLVSLIQISRVSDRTLRVCAIEDWPDLARRGYFGAYWPDCTEFTVMCKMNFVTHQGHCESDQFFSPLRTYLDVALAKEFRDLGLTLHYGLVGLTQCPQLPMCDRRTFDYRLETFRHYAQMGAGIYWPFDDVRFPVIAPDLKAFGPKAGTVADARHINEIYRATVKDYPDFSLIFCPPFYWGPDSEAWRSYPEDLYEYLPSVRTNLDPRVQVVWTGPRVKGWKKEKHKVKWITDLIGRKPFVMQNGAGAHNLLNYTVDVTDWNRWMHYAGFYDDVAAYQKNSATPTDCPQLTTLADCLWNEAGYDAVRSVREGVTMLMGDGVYEVLAKGLEALSYFDTYRYGSPYTDKQCRNENPALKGEKEDDLQAKLALGRKCWTAACKLAPRETALYGSYGRGVEFAARVLNEFQVRYGSKRTCPLDKQDVLTLDGEIPPDNTGGIESSMDLLGD